MKIWITLPNNFMNTGKAMFGYISTAAICPPLTKEMVEDELQWFDAEVTRRMDVGQICAR